MPEPQTRYIALDADATIATAFCARVARSPSAIAYREFDHARQEWRDYSWRDAAGLVARAREGLHREGLASGERIAIMLRNGVSWVMIDQSANAQGLVTVPLYVDDRPDNAAYIINDAEARLLIIEGEEQWKRLKTVSAELSGLKRILTVKPVADASEPRLQTLSQWLPDSPGASTPPAGKGDDLATIVYTSGTTGRPKGVMLSHRNMLANAQSGLADIAVYPDDLFLSFLPLSHMFERTVGYYLNIISGACVAFVRSVPQLAEDLKTIKPTVLMSVPRIYERFLGAINDQLAQAGALQRWVFNLAVETGWARFEYRQGRAPWRPLLLLWPLLERLVARKILARMGGRLRLAISGGAALSPAISRVFIGLGLPICQGYGLTEASPMLAVNRLEKNDPHSVGPILTGVEARIDENHALLVRGPNIMQGYWKQPDATRAVLSEDGWLSTGDQVRIDNGFVHIIGRTKEIIVLGNGEKVPPVDMELAIQLDPLFEQALVCGEGKPFLSALVVLNDQQWAKLAGENGLDASWQGESRGKSEKLLVQRIGAMLGQFPGYAQIRRVAVSPEKWTVDNGMLTSTLKARRKIILERYQAAVDELYQGRNS